MERPGPVLPLFERRLGRFRPPIAVEKLRRVSGEALSRDGVAKPFHQPLVEPQIMLGHQHRAEDFARAHEMVHISA